MEFDQGIRAYYDKGQEASRLFAGPGRLELVRTQELITRFLPQGPLEILDVGGGPGIPASSSSSKSRFERGSFPGLERPGCSRLPISTYLKNYRMSFRIRDSLPCTCSTSRAQGF